MKRGSQESRALMTELSKGMGRVYTKGNTRESERMKTVVKYHVIANPVGGHIQMCLCAEWEQDHIEKIIDGMTEGTRLEVEKKRNKRGESIKDGIQRKHRLPFSPLLPIFLLSV